MDIPGFLKVYQKSAGKIYQLKDCAVEYRNSIATAFSIGELQGDMKVLLRALCFFDPDKIPTDVLPGPASHDPKCLRNVFTLGFFRMLDTWLIKLKERNLSTDLKAL